MKDKTWWRRWWEFSSRNWWQVDLVKDSLLVAAVMAVIYLVLRLQKYGVPLLALLAIASCGSERQEQRKTVEKVETMTGPIIARTWAGDIQVDPVRHVMIRTQDTVTTESVEYKLPEVGAALSLAATSVPGLGIAGGVLGLLTATAAAWKAMAWKRQRDEVIDGVERAKTKLENIADAQMKPAWEHLTASLEAEQSRDTVAVVRSRTA